MRPDPALHRRPPLQGAGPILGGFGGLSMDNQVQVALLTRCHHTLACIESWCKVIRADMDCVREQLEEVNSRVNDMAQVVEQLPRKGVTRG